MASFQGNIKDITGGSLPLAYGPHVASGTVIQKVTEGTGDGAETTVIVWLGEGPWHSIKGYWGGAIISDESIHFHPGYLSESMDFAIKQLNPAVGITEYNQGVDPWNVGGQTYSGTAYAVVKLPVGVTSDDDLSKLKFVCECLRVGDYDEQGQQLDKDGNVVGTEEEEPKPEWFFYSTNAALCMADALLMRRGLPKSRINWSNWVAWKNVCGAQIPWVGGSVPDRPLFTNVTSNFSIGANAGVLKDSGGNAWNCGGITESVFPDNTLSFFEADAGAGTWAMGVTTATNLTNSTQIYLGFQGNVVNAGDESGILSIIRQGFPHTAISTWVAGDRFRVGEELVDGQPTLYVSKNGERLNISNIPPYTPGLHGGIALFHEGSDIIRSTMSPINTGTGGERVRTRFECGLAYTSITDISTVIESILYVSCSEIQDEEKITFLPPSMQTAPKTSQFSFNESNIIPDSFKTYRLARDQKPTKIVGRFRDKDTPTLKEDTAEATRDALVEILGRENPAPEVYLGSITRGQAECVLNYYIRKTSDLDLYCDFRATGVAWKPVSGDVVDVTKDEVDWNQVDFEIIESIDESSTETPDNRRFVCQLFNEACYSDTDQSPLNASITDLVTNEISAPRTPTGLTATFLINAVRYKWDKASDYYIIKEFEVWDSTNTNDLSHRLWHGLANGWTEAFTAGAPDSITRFVRAISILGTPSDFTSVTKNIATVVAPTNYTLSYDNNVLRHRFSPSSPATGVIRYEIATDENFTNIIFSSLSTEFDEIVLNVGNVTRYLRAIGMLEKPSATVQASTTVTVPAPPTNVQVTYDGRNIEWTWTPSVTTNVAYYEITNSSGTVVMDRVAFSHWRIPQIRGTQTYNYRVYTVTNSGLRSTGFLVLGFTIPAPAPVSNLTVAFDISTGLLKWSWTFSPSIDVESTILVDNAGILAALIANVNANNITEMPADGAPVVTRSAFVVSTNGQPSSSVAATFTAPLPSAPTISLNRQYPSIADVVVTGTIASRAVKNTVIKVSTGTGAAFNAGIIQTLNEAGKQERVSVFGRASQNATLYVKVSYRDVWGQVSSDSNELAVTFTPFLGSDLSNNSVTSLQLLLNNFDNLVEDPGFERGGTSWVFSSQHTMDTERPHSGTKALQSNNSGETVNNMKLDCKPGDTFYIECFVYAEAGTGGSAGARIKWYDANNNFISNSDFTLPEASATATWSLIGGIATAPANAVFAKPAYAVILQLGGTGAPRWFLDDMYFRKTITSAIIGIGVIQDAHIANATITSAKIHDLAADKLIAATGDIGLLFADRVVSQDYVPVPNLTTNLNGAIDDVVTTITVDSTVGFGDEGAISIMNDLGGREVVYYTGKTSSTFMGCERGQESSLATAHSDNSLIVGRGIGWMLHPRRGTTLPAVIEGNSGFSSQGVPATETTFRAVGAISENKDWRGNTIGVVPSDYISRGFIEISYGELDRAFVSLGVEIRNPEEANSGYGSIDLCEVLIRNKFGELVTPEARLVRSWKGQGHIGDFTYARKYADAWEEAVFQVRIHNYHGWSNPVYISNSRRDASWGAELWSSTTAPVYLAKQNCPLELIASPEGPDTVRFTWQAAVANASTQFVNARKRGPDGWETWQSISGAGLSNTTNSFVWTAALPYTDYEFFVENSGSTGAKSNIAFCKTTPQAATVTRPAPSNVVGTAQSTTLIVWSWTRNATDNTDVEISLDGGTWTSLGSATTTTTSSTVTAGTTHTLRVRNKWSSGTTLSAEAGSNSVTTPISVPASTDPSNLSLMSHELEQITASWTNNGTVNQTIEYKLSTSSTWTIVSLGAVSTHTISGLLSGRFYNVRVKATSGTNYITSSISTLQPEDPDPFTPRECVLLDSLISMDRGLVDYAGAIQSGDTIMTGKYNTATVEESVIGETTSYILITNSHGDVLGCSPSHPFITNLDETTKLTAEEIYKRVCASPSRGNVFVKMNDLGQQYMSRVATVEWIQTTTKVWIPKLSHPDHTFIANKFVSHNIKAV